VLKTKAKWYQEGLRFECTQCGNCCSGPPGYVWVTKEEIRAIAKLLGRTNGTLDQSLLRRVGLRYSLTEKPGGDCIFLRRQDGGSCCSIYAARPRQCRTWPFWSSNLSSPRAWRAAALTCPGMDQGDHYSFVAIEELRLRNR
jgi:Fe-S-cluster containining protein